MNTEALGYKEYKCPKCGWVHAAVRLATLPREDISQFLRCFKCRAPSFSFVPAEPADAPDGCTLQPVVVRGAWGEFLT